MSAPRRRRVDPFWCLIAFAAGFTGVCHVLGLHAVEDPAVQPAFWQFLLVLVGFIWDGLHTAVVITLTIVANAVQILFAFVRGSWNALIGIGQVFAGGFKYAWGFLRVLYGDILLPAWQQWWALVDRVRGVLERVVLPVLRLLDRVRDEFLAIYARYVRPVLDAIEIARKWLRVLSALHLDVARTLERKLAALEEAIDRPFRFVLNELNKIINVVNRVLTADGLFQRLALIRSIERDIRWVSSTFFRSQTSRLPQAVRDQRLAPLETQTLEEQAVEARALMLDGEGRLASRSEEIARDIRLALGVK